nr:dimethylsulfonioproprionate lyase family protein [Kiloniellales bacterium]
DAVVGEDMLAGYGFVEVVGVHGPFLSTRVRAGIGVWGPDIVYPPHRHRAEETYIVVAGAAEFMVGEDPKASASKRIVGDVVHVPSMTTHGFRTRDDPVAVLYLWQGIDLREKSSFG